MPRIVGNIFVAIVMTLGAIVVAAILAIAGALAYNFVNDIINKWLKNEDKQQPTDCPSN